MRGYPVILFALLVASTRGATSYNCIIGCQCKEANSSYTKTLKIVDCDSPLVLTQEALTQTPKKISTIGFKNVVIKTIADDAFDGFNELQSVTIENSSIGSVDKTAFDLPELTTISFTRTTFGEVPKLTAQYLEELIFNDCKLTEIPNLEQLPALTFLNLANNKIANLDERTFVKAESLEEVTLSNNSISTLPPKLFINNLNFITLNLDYNPLQSFELNLNSSLELLSLRYCNLSVFDRRITRKLDALSSLDLSGNEIFNLAIDTFDDLKDLNYLDLSNNKLVELDGLFLYENTKLDRVVLDNNQFGTLPNFESAAKVFPVHSFSCKNCSLTSLNSFGNMERLVTLELSDNKITNIEGVFPKVQSLKQLFLANNLITTVGLNAFGNDTHLTTLDLSNNPLSPLDPVVLANIQALTKLNISHCGLTQLWANHNAIIPSLERLYAENNKLDSVTVDDVKVTPNLKLIGLGGNVLTCAPELLTLVKYLLSQEIYPDQEEDVIKTHDKMFAEESSFYPQPSWKEIIPSDCVLDLGSDGEDDVDSDDDNQELSDNEDEHDDDDDEDDDDGEYDDNTLFRESIVNENHLLRASDILSITSVFILTALVVLTVAVTVTLLILNKQRSYNRNDGNRPRFKIPLWHTTLGQKKHSGSIYRPLSEDLTGSRTPIISRYDFKQTAQIHNSIP